MKLRQLTDYTKNILRRRQLRSLMVCLALLGTELFFRLAETALYSVILYLGDVTPGGLFTGESKLQQIIAVCCTVLRYLTSAPLVYAAAHWFCTVTSDKQLRCRKTSLSAVILRRKVYFRSLSVTLLTKLTGLLFLLPAFFFGAVTFSLVAGIIGNSDDTSLFMAVHAGVMTLISLFIWLRARLALTAVPYLMILFPKISPIGLIIRSFRLMKGRRVMLVRIFIHYITPMLFIVTVPTLLPRLFAAVSLFVSISLREDEYLERNKAHREFGQAHNAGELPA